MDVKRKAARGIAVLAVALAAGHLAQNMGHKADPKPQPSAALATEPAKVETVAAGPEAVAPTLKPATLPVEPVQAAPLAANTLPTPPSPKPEPVAPQLAAVEALPDQPSLPKAPKVTIEVRKADPAATAKVAAVPDAADQSAPETANACDVTLELMAEANAMIGVTLLAPCNPSQRVVLRQGGLAITGQTTATGALFTTLPAMERAAIVEASFGDGTAATAEIEVPELASMRRFGVQWQADDAFQVHAFENGATYGQPGHVSAADPHRPAPGLTATSGFLTLLGDTETENPLLAEVYTYPADQTSNPEVVVEAAVTDKTCGRELIAETLTSTAGSVFVTDLTLAMPDCEAVGDYLVLKNLVLDLNMAAAN